MTIDGLGRLARAAGAARDTLAAVAAARTRQLEALAGWRGGHARLHRRSTAALADRMRLVAWSASDLEGRLALVRAGRDASVARDLAHDGSAVVAVDPDVLRAALRDVAGNADRIRVRAAALRAAAVPPVSRDALALARTLAAIADELDALDAWTDAVAGALAAVDARAALRLDLLGLSTVGPAARLATTLVPTSSTWEGVGPSARDRRPWAALANGLADAPLVDLLGRSALPTGARDTMTRCLLDRWRRGLARDATRIGARGATAGAGILDRVATLADDRLLDPLDGLVRLHLGEDELAAHLDGIADGMARLLVEPDVTLLGAGTGAVGHPTVVPDAWHRTGASLGPSWPRTWLADPWVRLALGDPASATHLAVLVPGTGSGVGSHADALADARALQASLAATAPAGARPVVVLELYDAPADLAAAASPVHAEVAARGLAAGLAAVAPHDVRTTLVGHSYGAVVVGLTAAGQGPDGASSAPGDRERGRSAAAAAVDALVVLGAPGLGVTDLDELAVPADEVWAARADGDPIALVGDVPGLAGALGVGAASPLRAPTAGHGPDPAGPAFGARRLPTDGPLGTSARGHLRYLAPGTASLAATTAVVLGHASVVVPRADPSAAATTDGTAATATRWP